MRWAHFKKTLSLSNGTTLAWIECPVCHKECILKAKNHEFEDWIHGQPAQVAFPRSTADFREQLISGICGKCWDQLFPKESE